MTSIIAWIIVGALAGWIASVIMKTNANMGAFANIAVGVVGAFIGGWVMGLFGVNVTAGELNFPSVITAIVGAVILLWVVKLFRRTA